MGAKRKKKKRMSTDIISFLMAFKIYFNFFIIIYSSPNFDFSFSLGNYYYIALS